MTDNAVNQSTDTRAISRDQLTDSKGRRESGRPVSVETHVAHQSTHGNNSHDNILVSFVPNVSTAYAYVSKKQPSNHTYRTQTYGQRTE
jgi:hypothetical protein